MKVFAEKIAEYELPAVSRFLSRVFAELDLKEKLKDSHTILIKPNLLGVYEPDRAVTTHPVVVEAVIMILQALGKEVWLGDSPGGAVSVERVWEVTGMKALCEHYQVKLVNFNAGGVKSLQVGERQYNPVDIFYQVDAVIDIAKYKTHQLMSYTGCIKNLYGLIPGLKKSDYHSKYPSVEEFGRVISDIYQLSRQQICLNILDGIMGMEGEGPSAGEVRRFGMLFASESGSALDWQAARMMGFARHEVEYVYTCLEEEGIKESAIEVEAAAKDITFSNVKIKRIGKVLQLFQKSPAGIQNLFRGLFNYYPAFNDHCRLCGVCRDSCPVGAITIKAGARTPEIDLNKCIKCMCCHELCPYQAVYIHKSLLARYFVK